MSDGDALLRAILEHPAEDVPRLLYADWLQENGEEERATWIRGEVAEPRVTRLGPGDSISFRGAEVARGIPAWRGKGVYPDGNLYFSRGFAFEASCTGVGWLRLGPAITWSPSARITCAVCGGYPRTQSERKLNFQCRSCGNVGSASQLFPSTPQPLTAVTLTTLPEVLTYDRALRLFHFPNRPNRQFQDLIDEPYTWTEIVERMLEAEWPSIKFVLPVPEAA